jgi:hypothetical protein
MNQMRKNGFRELYNLQLTNFLMVQKKILPYGLADIEPPDELRKMPLVMDQRKSRMLEKIRLKSPQDHRVCKYLAPHAL